MSTTSVPLAVVAQLRLRGCATQNSLLLRDSFFAGLFGWLLLCALFCGPVLWAQSSPHGGLSPSGLPRPNVVICCSGGGGGGGGAPPPPVPTPPVPPPPPGPASTTTNLTLSSASIAAGAVETLSAQVVSGSTLIAPGTITFYDGKTVLGTAQLNPNTNSASAGTATLRTRFGIGTHSISASFAGIAGAFTKSSAAAQTLTVTGLYPTTTSIAQSGSAGNYSLTATVVGNGSPSLAPTGTVSFVDTTNSNNVLGSAGLGSATAGLLFNNSANPATGSNPEGVAVGDFNGDGIPDLAATNGTNVGSGIGTDKSNTVTVLLGNGDGTFTAASGNPAIQSPGPMAVGDFNSDGIPDLAIVTGDNALTVLLGNGDGTFTAVSSSPATGSGPGSIVVGDFNSDGIPDLAVANIVSNTVTLLLGKGDGTFTAASSSPATGNDPNSIAVGDFNSDGIPDLAVANLEDSTVTVLLGKGDGTFTNGSTPGTDSNPTSIAVGDFNRDGISDLATANDAGTVTVLLGKGDGTFTAASASPQVSIFPESIAVGDFNDDGIPDLAVASPQDEVVTVFLGKGDGTFNNSSTLGINLPVSLAVADFNGDGIADFAAASNSGIEVSVWLSTLTQTASATVTGIAPAGSGTHNVDASYPGDSNYNSSVSSTTALTGSQIGTTLTLKAVPTTTTFGQQVLLTATLTPFSGQGHTTDGDSIVFTNQGAILGTGALSLGVATLNVTSLPVGLNTLEVSFGGDTNFLASSSPTIPVTVSKATPTVTWTTPAAITFGTALSSTQLDATASVGGRLTYNPPAGTVLNAGLQQLAVFFVPNDTTDFNSPIFGSVRLQVNPASQTITWATIGSQSQGGTVKLSATGGQSGNAVTFSSSTPAVCTVSSTTATLIALGTCTIQATQAGNGNYLAATPVTQSFNVTPVFVLTATPSSSKTPGNNPLILTLQPVNGFNGSVTLNCTGLPTGAKCPGLPVTVKLNGASPVTYATGVLFANGTKSGVYVITFTAVSGKFNDSTTETFMIK